MSTTDTTGPSEESIGTVSESEAEQSAVEAVAYAVLGIVVIVLAVVVLVPPYLVLTVLFNAYRVLEYVVDELFERTRLRARFVGTSTLQRRLEGEILAARADVRRVAHELVVERGTELTEQRIAELDEFINYRTDVDEEPFRLTIPWRDRIEGLLGSQNISLPSVVGDPAATARRDEPIPTDLMWARTAMEMLNQAESNLRENTEAAYRAYLRAERYLVEGEILLARGGETDAVGAIEDTIQSHARLLWDEMSTRGGERLSTVRDLLFAPPTEDEGLRRLKPDLSPVELDKAMLIRNRARIEDFRRVETLRVNILSFVAIAGLLIAGALVFSPTVGLAVPAENFGIDEQLLLPLVLAFGALGAAISGVRNIEHNSESLQVLEQILGYWLSVVRMFVGALSAFIVAIFLFSGVVEGTFLTVPLVLGISLAAGFSERLLLRAISSFEGKAGPGLIDTPDAATTSSRRREE